jgi:hypothetical protein
MNFSDADLRAYLDEALPVAKMTAIEAALRESAELRARAAEIRDVRDEQGHSLGEIWRRERLSCPTRHQLGAYLLGALEPDYAQYVVFHLETIGCRYCAANLDDLRSCQSSDAAQTSQRRQKFFQSSAGQMRKSRDH